jgi:hypothetical protein
MATKLGLVQKHSSGYAQLLRTMLHTGPDLTQVHLKADEPTENRKKVAKASHEIIVH